MDARQKPTGRKFYLGQQLRRYRKAKHLTIEQAAEGLSFSEATLQRIETGHTAFRRVSDLIDLLDRYGITDRATVNELTQILRDSPSNEWVEELTDAQTPSQMTRLVSFEEAARSLRVYHPLLPWGPLQTEAYARATFQMQQPVVEAPTESVDRAVRLRVRRRECLIREDAPVTLHAVIGEAALRQITGSVEVMREQCDDLVTMAERDNIEIQILPLTGRRYRWTADFSIIDLGGDFPRQVAADNAWGALSIVGGPRNVGVATRRFERLAAAALPPEETPDFIRKLAQEIT